MRGDQFTRTSAIDPVRVHFGCQIVHMAVTLRHEMAVERVTGGDSALKACAGAMQVSCFQRCCAWGQS